jgi:ferritin-like metal-binding protein YciE
MNELASQKITQHLFEAHATELMLVQTLTAHIAMTPAGDYRDVLRSHLKQTREHAERIQKHLAAREQARGILQVGYGIAQSLVGQVFAVSKLPVDLLRGVSGEEMLLKNARDECANEAMEIATYRAIEELAIAAEDMATARLAASIRKDEERMLERLLELIPRLASDVMRAEVEGEPRYDLRHVGAVDVAWSVAGSTARTLARSARRASAMTDEAKEPTRRMPSPRPASASADRGPAKRPARSTKAKATTKARASSKSKASTRAKGSTRTTRA